MRFHYQPRQCGADFLCALTSHVYAPDNGEDNRMQCLAMAATLSNCHAKNSNHLRQNL